MAPSVIFGDYFLLGRLNRGGMAEVFLAKSMRPGEGDRLLAIKRTLPEFAKDQDFVSMFTDEATIAKGLTHPNISRIYDQGRSGDQLFIVMEFVHGKDSKVLQHRARERKQSIPDRYVAYIIARIAEALDFAHNKRNDAGELENIVHRDVSPQNILISYDGVPKLIDFGIAKAKSRIAQTQVGVLKGKFAYMSPEQAMGQEVDRRTDVFALGVVLYEIITGKRAFKGSSDFSTLQHVTQAQYTPPAELNPDAPAAVVAIINKALARERADRYPSAAAMAADLDAFVASEPSQVTPAVLAAYMRELFREDYTRETGRISSYLATKPPAAASDNRVDDSAREATPGAKEPTNGSGTRDDDAISDTTGIAPSIIVPDETDAGGDAGRGSGARASGGHISGTHSAATPSSGAHAARASGTHAAGATPSSGAHRAASAPPPHAEPTTRRITSPLGSGLHENQPPPLAPQRAPAPATVAPASQGDFVANTEEIDMALAAPFVSATHQSGAVRATPAPARPLAGDWEAAATTIAPGSASSGKHRLTPAAAAPTPLEAMATPIEPGPAAAAAPGGWDDELEAQTFGEPRHELPTSEAATVMFGSDQSASGAKTGEKGRPKQDRASAAKSSGRGKARNNDSAETRVEPSPSFLTGMEIAVLLVVALLGAGIVGGLYLYLSSQPIAPTLAPLQTERPSTAGGR